MLGDIHVTLIGVLIAVAIIAVCIWIFRNFR